MKSYCLKLRINEDGSLTADVDCEFPGGPTRFENILMAFVEAIKREIPTPKYRKEGG